MNWKEKLKLLILGCACKLNKNSTCIHKCRDLNLKWNFRQNICLSNVKSQPTIPLLSVQPPSGYYFISVTVSRSSSPWPTEDERGRTINCPKPAKRDFHFIQNYLTVHYFDMLIWLWKYISEYVNQCSRLN